MSDHDSIHGHRNLDETERSVIAHHQNFNAPKICKITVSWFWENSTKQYGTEKFSPTIDFFSHRISDKSKSIRCGIFWTISKEKRHPPQLQHWLESLVLHSRSQTSFIERSQKLQKKKVQESENTVEVRTWIRFGLSCLVVHWKYNLVFASSHFDQKCTYF